MIGIVAVGLGCLVHEASPQPQQGIQAGQTQQGAKQLQPEGGMMDGRMMGRGMSGGGMMGGHDRGAIGAGMMMRMMFSLMDADGDGSISWQEFQSAHERIFRGMDQNKDGVAIGEPLRPEPVVPTGYRKIAPGAVNSSEQVLAQTATIFRGVLKDVQFTYDDCAGARTNYVFSNSTSLIGTQVQPQVTLRVFGGPTPYGTWIDASTLPQLALDSEYIVFLRNTDWTFSPIVGDLVFRREMIDGHEVLVNPLGRAVTGWGDNGPLLSGRSVSEPVGHQLRGYRGSEASQQATHSSSAETDPNPEVRPADGNPPVSAPGRIGGSAVMRAPSLSDARKAGLFGRPALSATAIANESVVSAESLVAAVRVAADRAHINIGGRITLDPYWRCWSSTPTVKAKAVR